MAAMSHPVLAESPHRHQALVARIEKSQLFRDYRSSFQTATGLPLVLRAAGSFQEPLAGSKQINPFCALIASRSKSCAACLQLQQRAEAEAISGSCTLECFAGLNESVVPVRLGETVVAYLQTGQVMFRAPSEKKFRAAVRQLEQWNAIGDVVELEAAYFQTRVLARPNYEAIVRLLGSFAAHLSLLSNELMIKQERAEPTAISKARTFIAEHLGDALSLPDVARVASMSAFYFCKMFKKTVGLTFTEYVARIRIEKAKQILLDPNVRVSEAAFGVGFQSLSQFNRVFRRIAGESPTQYRDELNHATTRTLLPRAA
jgi:AraC-like DNA-binding protein/ligand-binding sensor protein